LQNAVSQDTAQGAKLTVSPDVAQGKPGGVSLSLPADLMGVLRQQGAKFGFNRAARKADVSATLSGDGYTVMPNGAQTQPLKAGQAAQFSWQVTPGQNASGPLRAQISASLKGRGEPQPLSLATVQSAAAPATAKAQQAVGGLHLPDLSAILGVPAGQKAAEPAQAAAPATSDTADAASDTAHAASDMTPAASAASPAAAPAPTTDSGLQSPLHDRTLPIIGRVSARSQIAALLAFLAVLILLLIQRSMSEHHRAEERRRLRAGGGHKPMDLDREPAAPTHSPEAEAHVDAGHGAETEHHGEKDHEQP